MMEHRLIRFAIMACLVYAPAAWATYEYVFKLVANGEVQTEDRGLCTSILRKEASTWLIQHEHCSRPRPAK